MVRKRGAGFTIVELIITIVILVILTTLAVVRLSSTQVSGRDHERQIDVETIATGLELYYENGNPLENIPKGYYPGGVQIEEAASPTFTPPFREFLEGVSEISYIAPDRSLEDSFGVDPNYATSPVVGANNDGSYNDTQVRALLSTKPYLYQPLRRNNSFCANYTDCVKFNLYYLLENSDTVVKIRSQHQ